MTKLSFTQNKLADVNQYYTLVNQETEFTFYSIGTQLHEKFYRDRTSTVPTLMSGRFLFNSESLEHSRTATQLSTGFAQIAGLAFVLSLLFAAIASPVARYFYTMDMIKLLF